MTNVSLCYRPLLDALEYAFFCDDGLGGRTQHSYGVGGFDAKETYLTDVKCAGGCVALNAHVAPLIKETRSDQLDQEVFWDPSKLKIPTDDKTFSRKFPLAVQRQGELRRLVKTYGDAVFDAGGGDDPKAKASIVGPGACGRMFKSVRGTCVLETRCNDHDLSKTRLGFTCVDLEGRSVRHVFEENAFLQEETFDTNVPCSLCLGLDVEVLLIVFSLLGRGGSRSWDVEEGGCCRCILREWKVLKK